MSHFNISWIDNSGIAFTKLPRDSIIPYGCTREFSAEIYNYENYVGLKFQLAIAFLTLPLDGIRNAGMLFPMFE